MFSKKIPAKGQQIKEIDKVKVFCLMRSLQNDNDISCIKTLSKATVSLTPPDTSVSFRNGNDREIHCSFHHVFEEVASHETIFEHTTLPLINDVFRGKNGLLFTYGLSGSGKTYTMTGEPQNTGIIPRSLDVIFSSVMHLQAEKFIFIPDKMNGFEVQSEEDAWKERQREINAYMKSARPQKLMRTRDDPVDCGQQTACCVQLESVDENSTYAIFVSCVEIYNNVVYDLLEDALDFGRSKQGKLVREDSDHNMYVHGVVEVEVKSSKEAYEIFYKAMRRKRMAFTFLNSDSSRSHSVFTIRVVKALCDRFRDASKQKEALCINQLCLVDLAGSERTNRTKNTGQRLQESGSINNSLMTLKTCLEILRENQMLGTKKLVPYRDSKLTYLLKNFFEGESYIHGLICVNPRAADFDETVHVMKFANTVKEVQVKPQSSARKNAGFPLGRRRVNQIFQETLQKLEQDNRAHSSEGVCSLSTTFPCLELKDPMNDKMINNVAELLVLKNEQHSLLRQNWVHTEKEFRDQLRAFMQKNVLAVNERINLQCILDYEKSKRIVLEAKVSEMDARAKQFRQELDNKCEAIRMVKQELTEKKVQLQRQMLENKRSAQTYHAKLTDEMDKGACNMHYLLRKQEAELKKMAKQKTKALSKVKHILVDEVDYSTPSSSESISSHSEHKSAQALMQSGKSGPQTAESLDVSGQALTTLHSVQDLAQARTTVLSQNTPKAIMVPMARNGIENLKKHSPLATHSRRKTSITSPIILSEDESNTSAVA